MKSFINQNKEAKLKIVTIKSDIKKHKHVNK